MARRQAFSKDKGIKGKHRPKQNKVFLYLVLLVAVVIVMISLNNMGKKPDGDDGQNRGRFTNPLPNSSFTKEGELELFNQADSLLAKLDIEIADDDAQTTRGLMYRRSMGEYEGMLFIFPSIEERSFWMKNTFIPLDLIFLDENRIIVHIHENASTKSEESIPSLKPAKYVLEVNAGFSAMHYLKVGDRMSFKRTY